MERAQDILHPTVSVLPKRPLTVPPAAQYAEIKNTEIRSSDLISSPSSNHSSSLSNGDMELEKTNGVQQPIEWPEVGKLPGVYGSRHEAPMILIFLKWFDVESQRLRGQCPVYVNRNDKTGKLTSVVAEMMNWHAEPGEPPVNIAFYEEIKPGMIEPLKPNASFVGSEIQDGDIICFMRVMPSKRYRLLPTLILTVSLDEMIKEGKYTDPIRYYEFLSNKVTLKFLPRYPDQAVKQEFYCVLSKNMKYEQVQTILKTLLRSRLLPKLQNI